MPPKPDPMTAIFLTSLILNYVKSILKVVFFQEKSVFLWKLMFFLGFNERKFEYKLPHLKASPKGIAFFCLNKKEKYEKRNTTVK